MPVLAPASGTSQPPYPLHASIVDKLDPQYVAFYNKHIINAQQVHYQPVAASRVGGKLIPGGSNNLPVDLTQDFSISRQETEGPEVDGQSWFTFMAVVGFLAILTQRIRLAPEDPFPAAVHDSWEALLWTVSKGVQILNLNKDLVAIGGSSAGGNLAAVLTQKATELLPTLKFRVQLLIVPVTDNTAAVTTNATYKSCQFTAALPAEKMLWYRNHYLPDQTMWTALEASPLLAPLKTFAKLPPAVILVGELDVLRWEGEEYARKLNAAGVHAKVELMKGMPHPFLAMDGVLDEGKRAITILCESLKDAFASPSADLEQ
ncbi:hypothetical protein LTR64_000706 [Lithohypha guttulata]|uniref:uncharacterized protein n=1 Tax=Lithohypha guttulata TaxID=1690604 RepID=UPI00315D6665